MSMRKENDFVSSQIHSGLNGRKRAHINREVPFRKGSIDRQLVVFSIFPSHSFDARMRFVIEIVKDRSLGNTAGTDEGSAQSFDLFTQPFGFLQAPGIPFVVIE